MKTLNERTVMNQERLLGKGSTGNVYWGEHGLLGCRRPVAIKVIDLSTIDNQVTQYLLHCQLEALKVLSNPPQIHTVNLHEIVHSNNKVHLIMEYLAGGTLSELIKQNPKGLDEPFAIKLFTQIVEGYYGISKNKIIHRDLKPQNIIFKHATVKDELSIIDFGYCTMESVANKPQIYYNVGSPRYMAPQAYNSNCYSEKSDIWALGIILYEMLVGKTFDIGLTIEQTHSLLLQKGVPFPVSVSSYIRKIISKMLSMTPANRYSCEMILKELKGQSRIITNSNTYPTNQVPINTHEQQQQQQMPHIHQIPQMQQQQQQQPKYQPQKSSQKILFYKYQQQPQLQSQPKLQPQFQPQAQYLPLYQSHPPQFPHLQQQYKKPQQFLPQQRLEISNNRQIGHNITMSTPMTPINSSIGQTKNELNSQRPSCEPISLKQIFSKPDKNLFGGQPFQSCKFQNQRMGNQQKNCSINQYDPRNYNASKQKKSEENTEEQSRRRLSKIQEDIKNSKNPIQLEINDQNISINRNNDINNQIKSHKNINKIHNNITFPSNNSLNFNSLSKMKYRIISQDPRPISQIEIPEMPFFREQNAKITPQQQLRLTLPSNYQRQSMKNFNSPFIQEQQNINPGMFHSTIIPKTNNWGDYIDRINEDENRNKRIGWNDRFGLKEKKINAIIEDKPQEQQKNLAQEKQIVEEVIQKHENNYEFNNQEEFQTPSRNIIQSKFDNFNYQSGNNQKNLGYSDRTITKIASEKKLNSRENTQLRCLTNKQIHIPRQVTYGENQINQSRGKNAFYPIQKNIINPIIGQYYQGYTTPLGKSSNFGVRDRIITISDHNLKDSLSFPIKNSPNHIESFRHFNPKFNNQLQSAFT